MFLDAQALAICQLQKHNHLIHINTLTENDADIYQVYLTEVPFQSNVNFFALMTRQKNMGT